MAAVIDELARAADGTRVAPDYAPSHQTTELALIAHAFFSGTSSIMAPWDGLNDRAWWTPPARDRFLIGLDFWRGAYEFAQIAGLPFDVHPGQERLFDPDALDGT